MTSLRAVAPWALWLLLCACENREQTEAQLLLDRMAGLDPGAPTAMRQARIRAIEELSLSSQPILEARDLCVRAHTALVAVETAQAQVRDHLAAVEGEEARLTPEDRAEMETALATAQRDLVRANEQLPRCQQRIDALTARFGKRR